MTAFRVHYVAAPGQTIFTVPVKFSLISDLNVYVNGVLKTFSDPPANSGLYNVTGVGDEDGGTIIFGPPGLAVNDRVIIMNDEELLLATTDLQRTVRLDTTDFLNPLNPLPDTAVRANKLLGFDASGHPTVLAQLQGPAGEDGAEGPEGPAGPTGPEGPAGPAGADASHANSQFTGVTTTWTSTDSGALGNHWQAYHLSATPAANDVVLKIEAFGRDSALNSQSYGSMSFIAKAVTNTAEQGMWSLDTVFQGTARQTLLAEYGQLSVIRPDASGAAAGPYLKLKRQSTAPANGMPIGGVQFWALNGVASDEFYADITAKADDITSNNEKGSLSFWIAGGTNGSLQEILHLTEHNRGGSTHFGGSFNLEYDENGSTRGPVLRLKRDSTSPAALDELGTVDFLGKTTTGVMVNYADITAEIEVPCTPPTTGDGVLKFSLMLAGVGTTVLTLAKSAATLALKLITPMSTTARAGLNIPPGSAPTTPVSGDVWGTPAGLYYHAGAITYGPFGDVANAVNMVLKAGDTMTGDLTITKSGPTLYLNTTSALAEPSVMGQLNGVYMWGVELGTPEAKNFSIDRYDDANNYVDSPIEVSRDNGRVIQAGTDFTGKVQIAPANPAGTAKLNLWPSAGHPLTKFNGDMWSTDAGVYAQINNETARLATTDTHQEFNSRKTFTVPPVLPAATEDLPSYRMEIGGAPAFPEPGWVWMDDGGLFYCVEDGVVVGPLGEATSIAWENITGKPDEFPPVGHQHPMSDIQGLSSAFDDTVEEAPYDDTEYARRNAEWVPVPGPRSSGIQGYSLGSTTVAPPVVGGIRLNNFATQSAATIIWMNYTNEDGVDLKTYYQERVKAGDTLYLQDRDDATKWQLYEITAAFTDNTTYASIPVIWKAGGASLLAQRVVVTRESAGSTGSGLGNTPIVGDGTDKAELRLNGGADPTDYASIIAQRNGSNRWGMNFTNLNVESTGNAGSDYSIIRYSDAGSPLGLALEINRKTGTTKLEGLAIPHATPATPIDGQIWTTSAGVHARINGSTMQVSPGWMQLTQVAYDAIATKDPNMLYVVIG